MAIIIEPFVLVGLWLLASGSQGTEQHLLRQRLPCSPPRAHVVLSGKTWKPSVSLTLLSQITPDLTIITIVLWRTHTLTFDVEPRERALKVYSWHSHKAFRVLANASTKMTLRIPRRDKTHISTHRDQLLLSRKHNCSRFKLICNFLCFFFSFLLFWLRRFADIPGTGEWENFFSQAHKLNARVVKSG